MRFYSNDDLHYDDWLEILMALRQFDEEGRALCHEWSELSGKYNREDLDRRWDSTQGGEALLRLRRTAGHGRDPLQAREGCRLARTVYSWALAIRSKFVRIGRGTVIVVQGDDAYEVLDDRGYMGHRTAPGPAMPP